MLNYIINNLALYKIEDVKRYYKNDKSINYALLGLRWVFIRLAYGGLNHLQSL
jgi:hypothetical protein